GETLGIPLDRGGRLAVTPDLTLPGHPEVYVVGDLARSEDAAGAPLPGLAAVAKQEGIAAARNIDRTIRGEPRRPFRSRALGPLATTGRGAAVCDFGRVHLSGAVGGLAWLGVHLYLMSGLESRLLVLFQWAWSFFPFQRSPRLITQPWRPAAATT